MGHIKNYNLIKSKYENPEMRHLCDSSWQHSDQSSAVMDMMWKSLSEQHCSHQIHSGQVFSLAYSQPI